MPDVNILYVDSLEFEDGKCLRGGALVVSQTTEPLEFRCTSAVRPTNLQKILWGDSLGAHIAANLVGVPLMRAIKQKFSLVVVKTPEFLDMRENCDIPVVRLVRGLDLSYSEADEEGPATDGGITVDSDSAHSGEDAGAPEEEQTLQNPSGRFEPVVIQCGPGHADDMKAAREVLAPVFARRDVMEPFERVATALEAVHTEEANAG